MAQNGTNTAYSRKRGENRHGMSKRIQSSHLRLGFVPLTDCAPLVMAHELGLFGKYGLKVSLQRELGWATVRDKIAYRELDASHALAAMPLAATLGLGSIPCDCLTALVLSLNGNGITVSTGLFQSCFRGKASLLDEVRRLRGQRILTFGVVAPFSSHRHLLRNWLSAQGVNPERDVRIVVVPPPQMVANLKAGNLDGFCVGEPWNSAAAAARAGVCVATSEDLDAGHPEKVLMVRREFAEKRSQEHLALVAALIEGGEWCAASANHKQLIATLARPEYVGVPSSTLRRGVEEICVFPGRSNADPSGDKAAWVLELMRASGLCPGPARLDMKLARGVFRADLFDQAVRLLSANPTEREYETIRT
jgi:ABC-type nitrate/sulfonate/bicarbonate transport system substrate-binding protein